MIIGISGKIGSGKTTVAEMIQKIDPNYELVHFATALKMAAHYITGLPVEYFYDQRLKNQDFILMGEPMNPGEFLQWLGTDLMRNLYSNVWVDALMNKYSGQNWVVDDVRFQNEANAIRKSGGVLIRLEGDPSGIRAQSKRNLNHASETDLDDYPFDFILCTEKPKTETALEISDILKSL